MALGGIWHAILFSFSLMVNFIFGAVLMALKEKERKTMTIENGEKYVIIFMKIWVFHNVCC